MTSPPYWALRDYGVVGQLGLEPSVGEYIQRLCDVFDEVWRVLKTTGTCWVNLGDSYASSGMRNEGFNTRWHGKHYSSNKQGQTDRQRPLRPKTALPEKCLCLVPFRFAIEMVSRRWILRNVVIWHKPNCLPSSARDRFTVDFEYLFFFTKSRRYFFDPQFEPHAETTKQRVEGFHRNHERFNPEKHKQKLRIGQSPFDVLENIATRGLNPRGRNKRCVWTIPTQGFKEAHFATFPEKLVETPIRAGCPASACLQCGKPKCAPGGQEDCGCGLGFQPGIVLDPFFGAGTTGLVALKLKRRFIGIELNPEYVKLAKKRLGKYCRKAGK